MVVEVPCDRVVVAVRGGLRRRVGAGGAEWVAAGWLARVGTGDKLRCVANPLIYSIN